jgi:RNA polymerase sigma-70 factor (ECF subfamily)
MAAHLGSPIGSVKVWLRRGLEKLRRCLERAK